LRAAYRSTWLNRYGGEIFATGDIGSNPGLDVEFYQPLNLSQTYFVQPSYYRKRETFTIFSDDKKIAEYRLQRSYSELAIGKNLDIYGQVKLGWREYNIKNISEVSEIALGNYHQKYGGVLFDMAIDRRNRLHFPSRGWSGTLQYFDSSKENYSKLSSELNVAYPMNNFVLAGRTSYVRAMNGSLPATNAAYLGGFLNLSAFASNQIIADNALYAHLRGERIIGRMPLGLNGDMRLGIGLEGAKIKDPYNLDEDLNRLHSAVIYLGGETPLGPAYLGLGFTDDGHINVYMQIGAH
jgi:NTE family protein